MFVGINSLEMNHRVDTQSHEMDVQLCVGLYDQENNRYFLERMHGAMMDRDPVPFLLALLEGASGHTYVRGERTEPDARTPNDPRFLAPGNGQRAIDVGE